MFGTLIQNVITTCVIRNNYFHNSMNQLKDDNFYLGKDNNKIHSKYGTNVTIVYVCNILDFRDV